VGSGPTTPQTDAALSPRLLEILQYREQIHKRTLSDTTPLNADGRTATGSLPERSTSTVGHQTLRQRPGGGIMQILDATDQGRNSQPIPLSETPDTIENDVIWPTTSTILHRENLNRVPGSRRSTLDPPESTATTPSSQTGDSIPSDASSFTIADDSEYHHHMVLTLADAQTICRACDVRRSQGVEDVWDIDDTESNHGAPDPRGNRGEGDVREASNAKGPQQIDSPTRQSGMYDHDPPTLPSVEPDRNSTALGSTNRATLESKQQYGGKE